LSSQFTQAILDTGPYNGQYTGRFAPSPTGPLHAGSLVAALASWLDARAHGGRWLVRMEDVDTPRCIPGAAQTILNQLALCGLVPDEPPLFQSQRSLHYQAALDHLNATGHAYGCACSRKDIANTLAVKGIAPQRHAEPIYPGTCREGLRGLAARAWRFKVENFEQNRLLAQSESAQVATEKIAKLHWSDRRLGPQNQDIATEAGDFVLKRADGLWAYQLAVVVDDADQHITHVVRGEDLADNTARQILLQRALDLPTPQYLHIPLVLGLNGEKLSKQNGAAALEVHDPGQALSAALHALGLLQTSEATAARTVSELLVFAVATWRARYAQSASASANARTLTGSLS